jgi:hypothetical protein
MMQLFHGSNLELTDQLWSGGSRVNASSFVRVHGIDLGIFARGSLCWHGHGLNLFLGMATIFKVSLPGFRS